MTPKPLLLTLAALLLCAAQALAISAGGESRRLNEGWQFIRQDMGSIWEVMRPACGPTSLCPTASTPPMP